MLYAARFQDDKGAVGLSRSDKTATGKLGRFTDEGVIEFCRFNLNEYGGQDIRKVYPVRKQDR